MPRDSEAEAGDGYRLLQNAWIEAIADRVVAPAPVAVSVSVG